MKVAIELLLWTILGFCTIAAIAFSCNDKHEKATPFIIGMPVVFICTAILIFTRVLT